jgi:hypothetical protein
MPQKLNSGGWVAGSEFKVWRENRDENSRGMNWTIANPDELKVHSQDMDFVIAWQRFLVAVFTFVAVYQDSTLTLPEQDVRHTRKMEDAVISHNCIGTIVADFETLLEFIGSGVRSTGR